MKKIWFMFFGLILPIILISCGMNDTRKDIELMGAGDRIHDTFTFANLGVEMKEVEKNVYEVSGSVEKLDNQKIKQEFEIDESVNHIVAVKLSANGKEVKKEKVSIKVDGVKNYDAEHFNGTDYTFVLLEAVKSSQVSIVVSWNGEEESNYIVKFSDDLILK